MKKNLIFIIGAVIICVGALIAMTFSSKNAATLNVSYSSVTEDKEWKSELESEVKISDFEDLTTGQPMLGDTKAPLTMITFGDFKCSHCLNYENEVFDELYEKYIKTGVIKYYFVNMQNLTENSLRAGIIGEAIFAQSPVDYWNYHRAIYNAFSTDFSNEKLLSIVEENTKNVDLKEIEKVIKEPNEMLGEVYKDFYIAQQIGVQGTPTLILQGSPIAAEMKSIDAVVSALYDSEKKELRPVKEAQEALDNVEIE